MTIGMDNITVTLGTSEPLRYLGEVNADGDIWTTCGWSKFGPAWVTEGQIGEAERHGWKRSGSEHRFQGSTLFEMIRSSAKRTQP